jgi:uncharacterized protein CbrC (UPF0167 family)
VGTGSIVESEVECVCCGARRGFIYSGPVYAIDELDDALCPWCIADGSAAGRFDASFTDIAVDVPADVPDEVLDNFEHRTPSFSTWQQDHWLYHCADACAYLGTTDDEG